MKRTFACLAALAFGLVANTSSAQTPGRANNDPIADLIAQTAAAPRAFGTMAPIEDDTVLREPNAPKAAAVPGDADWNMRVTLYHNGKGGVGNRDSLGCSVVPMRTAAIDPRVAPKRSILYIPETVGLIMPDGSAHDGYWYASDTGGGIKGSEVDLFTGSGRGSMKPLMKINTRTVAVMKAGTFTGCPKAGGQVAMR
jgi:3D (Asp-Asp-Asp) domain-containing protein